MGAFLEKPKTEKTTSEGSGCGIKYGVSAMQGWRMEMEDAHVCNTGFKLMQLREWSIFGVFDGHAGSKVSNICAKELIVVVEKHFKDLSPDDLENNDKIEKALVDAFLELDSDTLRPLYNAGSDHSGSTAIVVMISPKKIIWANCGDSRGVLCRAGKLEFASEDHKPYNVKEKARIESAGGTVMMQRVNGSLAVSRALGDFDYKRSEDLKPEQQLVSPEPDITVLDRSQDDEFLVLACDGIYDVMSNEDVIKYVRRKLTLENELSDVCSSLIDTCLNKNSRDNMSTILVTFPNAPKVSQEAIDKDKEYQRIACEQINEELEKMANAATDPLDLDENYVMEELLKRFPDDYNIAERRASISEKLQELSKKRFGDLTENNSLFVDSEQGYQMDEQLLGGGENQVLDERAANPFGEEAEPMSSSSSHEEQQPPDTT